MRKTQKLKPKARFRNFDERIRKLPTELQAIFYDDIGTAIEHRLNALEREATNNNGDECNGEKASK